MVPELAELFESGVDAHDLPGVVADQRRREPVGDVSAQRRPTAVPEDRDLADALDAGVGAQPDDPGLGAVEPPQRARGWMVLRDRDRDRVNRRDAHLHPLLFALLSEPRPRKGLEIEAVGPSAVGARVPITPDRAQPCG